MTMWPTSQHKNVNICASMHQYSDFSRGHSIPDSPATTRRYMRIYRSPDTPIRSVMRSAHPATSINSLILHNERINPCPSSSAHHGTTAPCPNHKWIRKSLSPSRQAPLPVFPVFQASYLDKRASRRSRSSSSTSRTIAALRDPQSTHVLEGSGRKTPSCFQIAMRINHATNVERCKSQRGTEPRKPRENNYRHPKAVGRIGAYMR